MDNNKTVKKSVFTKAAKNGTFGVIVGAFVIAIAIIINLFVNSLPTTITKLDTTSYGLTTITEDTERIVKSIKDDITINLIASSGNEDNITVELINRYTALNGKIKYRAVDPANQPGFTAKYTEESPSENSLIVVNETTGRSKYVDKNDIYVVTYSDEEYMQYLYYGITPTGSTSYAGESTITSALDYVTTANLPKVYTLTGHGEAGLSSLASESIEKENIDMAELTLLTLDTVPSDADAVIITAPQKDLTENEVKMLTEYIENGGFVYLFTGYGNSDVPNLDSFTETFGMKAVHGLVFEGSSNNYMQYPYFCIPKLTSNDFSAKIPDNSYLIAPYAEGIVETENTDADVKVETLFKTTDSAYAKTEITENSTVEKEDGDAEGPFMLGAMATKNGHLLWFSCADFLSEQLSSFSNNDYFIASLTTLCGKEESISIATKAMTVEALNVSEASANFWFVVMIILIPLAALVTGFVIWFKRRTR